MTVSSINGVSTANQFVNPYFNNFRYGGLTSPLYNDSVWDIGSAMSTGYNPIHDVSMGYGVGMMPYGYDMYGLGGYGYYGMSPVYAQAMVQSQGIYMDGMAALNRRQRAHDYNGQIDTMHYDVKLNDAQDTHHEDKTRRDANINDIVRQINERLEAQDSKGFYEAYNYGLSLYAKVYQDVNGKRSEETPSNRAAIKAAFHKKYAELNGGKTIHQKIDETLPGAFGSGFNSVWRYEDVDSAESTKAIVDDRNMAYKKQETTYKTFGKITGGIANTGIWTASGAVAGGVLGAGAGAFFKKAGKFGKYGSIIGALGGLLIGAGRSISAA